MPQEIADSDDESDFNSPARPEASPIPENVVGAPPLSTLEQDPFANLEFDQFLSPTQRLSSAVERNGYVTSHSVNSTDVFLRELAESDARHSDNMLRTHGFDGSFEQASTSSEHPRLKRTFSDIEGTSKRHRNNDNSQQRHAKRTKTYGSSHVPRSETNSLFSDPVSSPHMSILGNTQEPEHLQSETTSTGIAVQPLVNPVEMTTSADSNSTERSRHNDFQHLTTARFSKSNIHNASITKSSVGGHQVINMDFRGVGIGLDMSANPFGSLSQVSLDGDIDLSQTERLTSLFQHSQPVSEQAPVEVEANAVLALQDEHLKEMATSSTSRPDHNLSSDTPEISIVHGETESVASAPKKRGRKRKTVQPGQTEFDTLTRPHDEDHLDLPKEQHKIEPSRSRAGTVDSVNSHVSQTSETSRNLKKKRQKPTVDPELAENTPPKHISSELNLSDPAMIGAPREMYVPRPSKSRARRILAEDDEDELSEDIGTLRQNDTTHTDDVRMSGKEPDDTPKSNAKKRSGRKSKVKRAKTSAAALLKSAEMYDEEDKDCIIVDEIPAKVNMAPLPEISPVKREAKDHVKNATQKDEVVNEMADLHDKRPNDPTSAVKIVIDIPKPVKTDDSKAAGQRPEPKKRGRKPKKKPQVEIQAENEDEEQAQDNIETPVAEVDTTRPALAEKDPNTTSSSNPSTDQQAKLQPESANNPASCTPSYSPKNQVHSPLKPKPPIQTPSISRAATPSAISSPSAILWTKPRIGLSRRTSIPSLLRKLDRTREPPKVVERKEKLSKRQQEEEARRRLEAEDSGEVYVDRWDVRGKDGMLVEWDE